MRGRQFCDVNVGGVQCFSYRQRRRGLFGGEPGAQQPVVDDFARSLADAPSAGQHTWTHNSARVFSVHHACYELRLYQLPPPKATLAQRRLLHERTADNTRDEQQLVDSYNTPDRRRR